LKAKKVSDCHPPSGPIASVAPFFSLTRADWIPYALTWDPETGAVRGVEGPRGFASYREAVEASRFLVGASGWGRLLPRKRGR
jgi:hypothetical protein